MYSHKVILLILFGVLAIGDGVYAFSGSYNATAYSLSGGAVTVSDGAVVNIGDLTVTAASTLINNGSFSGNINLGNTVSLQVRNAGNMNANFYLGNNARVEQLITNAAEITDIGMRGDNFIVTVQSESELSMRDILSVARSAHKIVLQNANLVIDGNDLANGIMPYLDLQGIGTFRINFSDGMQSGVVLRNLGPSGDYITYVDNVPDLFVAYSVMTGSEIRVVVSRQTDYRVVLGDKRGDFLNNLRVTNPDENLLELLDDAPDMDSLNAIMARSVRMNPINLMRPVRLLNSVTMMRLMPSGAAMGVGVMPYVGYTSGDCFGIYSLGLDGSAVVTDKLSVYGGGYFGAMSVADDINEFEALLYGGRGGALYRNDGLRVNIGAMVTRAEFDVGYVFDGVGMVNNPNGLSVAAIGDVGYEFKLTPNINLIPFVGGTAHYENVVDTSDSGVDGFLGSDLIAKFSGTDIVYEYGARLRRTFGGGIDFGLLMNVASPADGISVNGTLSRVSVDDISGYQLSLSAHIAF